VQTAHRSSDGITEFVKNLTILLFGTGKFKFIQGIYTKLNKLYLIVEIFYVNDFFSSVGCLACIGLAVVIPMAMVVIGSLYFSDCPVEPKIPLYLVVGGNKF
jgi:hypothetical protein